MRVDANLDIANDHSIEWGGATWDNREKSIRNRYVNIAGRFNWAGSSEMPRGDFKLMIPKSIEKKQFTNRELREFALKFFKRWLFNKVKLQK